jgi:hypothetical protein
MGYIQDMYITKYIKSMCVTHLDVGFDAPAVPHHTTVLHTTGHERAQVSILNSPSSAFQGAALDR